MWRYSWGRVGSFFLSFGGARAGGAGRSTSASASFRSLLQRLDLNLDVAHGLGETWGGGRAGEGRAELGLAGLVYTQASVSLARVFVAAEVELWKKITGVGSIFVAGVFLNWLASCVSRRAPGPARLLPAP